LLLAAFFQQFLPRLAPQAAGMVELFMQ
jgi:hypothetical protein